MTSQELKNTVAALEKGLAALEAAGEDHFDVVQFRYIASMTEKASQRNEPVAKIVANRAQAALVAYRSALHRERQRMHTVIQEVGARHPAAVPELQALFNANKLSALKRLAAGLDRRAAKSPLVTLLKCLESRSLLTGESSRGGVASGRLQEQENAELALTCADTCPAAAPPARELKSARYFRELRQQRAAQNRVSRALQDAPQESGPLNPQKLAIRSMLAMRDISPGYLARFVSYVDTLFWLESTGMQDK